MPLPAAFAESGAGRSGWCGTTEYGHVTATAAHQQERSRRGVAALSEAALLDSDEGDVAVLIDAGDLALPQNFLDMREKGVQFAPSGDGYLVSRVDTPLAPGAGETLSIGDDAAVSRPLPFPFPYYGQSHDEVWINSDGNLTFGRPEASSNTRDLGRFLTGPPRVAVLFADLDPSAGGTVQVDSTGELFRVTWTGVPRWGVGDQNSFAVTLLPGGRIDFVYGQVGGNLTRGVVGLTPGAEATEGFIPVDMSEVSGVETGRAAIAEGFRVENEVDLIGVAQRFYQTHGDVFQQLVIYSNENLMPQGVFAFETTINNSIAGIGNGIYDTSDAFGSAGVLESLVFMGRVSKFPDDLTVTMPIIGEDNALSVTAHEVGHRWLALARFVDGGTLSGSLLGRQEAHWSFFTNSLGSYLEGNEIEDKGGGQFETVGAAKRYSPLDQYLMGLRTAAEVPPFFYVKDPDANSSTDPGRSPETGVTFTGTRRDVSIDDVMAGIGPRDPAPGPQPPYRQAFILVVANAAAPNPSHVAKVEQIRTAFAEFFNVGTEGRGTVESKLN